MTEDAPTYDADLWTIIVDGEERTVTHDELQKMLGKGNVVHKSPRGNGGKSATRDTFLTLLVHRYGFALEVPFRALSGTRQFRWDAAHEGAGVAVEYSGFGPGHQWNAGLERDQEKVTEGQLCGWTVIICNSRSVKDGRCLDWIETALTNTPAGSEALAAAEDLP